MHDIHTLIRNTHISAVRIAAHLGIHPSTLRRYSRQNYAPGPVRVALEILAGDRAPSLHDEWRGWSMSGALLIDNHGVEYTPAEIRTIWIMRQQLTLLDEMQRPGYQQRLF